MIYVFYHQLSHRLSPEKFRSLFQVLPPEQQERNRGFRFWQEAQTHLIGKMLLKAGLDEMSPDQYSLQDLRYTVHQRPFFENGIDFNIAHSEDIAICALSKTCRVGVDVERVRSLSIDQYRNHFSEEEWKAVNKGPDPIRNFFRLWTEKESIVKAIGAGLGLPLTEIRPGNNQFKWQNGDWFTRELPIDPQYIVHVCSDNDPPEVVVRKIEFE
ncbi:MAG TPA: 4'-phosphopantetheinyl transferase superfamily protein [Flavisolibacter sp.]|nr:4'-phosphopantetheinyl transferase superfamily protein [Flavisolibacter sp.]